MKLKDTLPGFEAFLESLDIPAYMSDPRNYELVYVNHAMRDFLSLGNLELNGVKCYEGLFWASLPCCFCRQEECRKESSVSYEFPHPRKDVNIKACDFMVEIKGKEYHVSLTVPTSLKLNAETVTKAGARTSELFVHGILEKSSAYGNSDDKILAILSFIREYLSAKAAYIYHAEEDYLVSAYFVTKDIATSKVRGTIDFPTNQVWYEAVLHDQYYYGQRDERDLESYPKLKTALGEKGGEDFLVLPLFMDGKLYGYLTIDDILEKHIEPLISGLLTTTTLIGSLLKNRLLEKELIKYSNQDSLTGLGNRHALDGFIHDHMNDETIGYLFMDLNDLKKINDEYGHEAGDTYILKTARTLRNRYSRKTLFRMGGDEFLVLLPNIRKDDLDNEKTIVRNQLNAAGVTAAIGSYYSTNGTKTFDKDFAKVDAKMYETKKRMKAEG